MTINNTNTQGPKSLNSGIVHSGLKPKPVQAKAVKGVSYDEKGKFAPVINPSEIKITAEHRRLQKLGTTNIERGLKKAIARSRLIAEMEHEKKTSPNFAITFGEEHASALDFNCSRLFLAENMGLLRDLGINVLAVEQPQDYDANEYRVEDYGLRPSTFRHVLHQAFSPLGYSQDQMAAIYSITSFGTRALKEFGIEAEDKEEDIINSTNNFLNKFSLNHQNIEDAARDHGMLVTKVDIHKNPMRFIGSLVDTMMGTNILTLYKLDQVVKQGSASAAEEKEIELLVDASQYLSAVFRHSCRLRDKEISDNIAWEASRGNNTLFYGGFAHTIRNTQGLNQVQVNDTSSTTDLLLASRIPTTSITCEHEGQIHRGFDDSIDYQRLQKIISSDLLKKLKNATNKEPYQRGTLYDHVGGFGIKEPTIFQANEAEFKDLEYEPGIAYSKSIDACIVLPSVHYNVLN